MVNMNEAHGTVFGVMDSFFNLRRDYLDKKLPIKRI
jgi:hypothetical protein